MCDREAVNYLAAIDRLDMPSSQFYEPLLSLKKPALSALQIVHTWSKVGPRHLTLQMNVRFSEPRALELRIEVFNAFNHAQFCGPASVNGQVEDPNFG
jgi:hypothetical protein